MFPTINEQMDVIKRGVEEIIPEDELVKKIENSIKNNKPLIIKEGFDPTAPDLHIGGLLLARSPVIKRGRTRMIRTNIDKIRRACTKLTMHSTPYRQIGRIYREAVDLTINDLHAKAKLLNAPARDTQDFIIAAIRRDIKAINAILDVANINKQYHLPSLRVTA